MPTPGSTTHRRPAGSTPSTRRHVGDRSSTTARLVHCPARLVPPPRGSNASRRAAQYPTTASTAAVSLGTTTPTGSTWYSDASVE